MSVAEHARARKGALVAALLFGAALLSQPAAADARLCRQLEAELASAQGGGGSAQYRKYDRAVSRQSEQISIARRQARGAGCDFFILGRRPGCGDVNAKIDRMERNLDALQRKRAQLAGGNGSRRDRSRILAALDANGCRGQRLAERPLRQGADEAYDRGSLFDQLFGGRPRRDSLDGLRTSTLNGESGQWHELDHNQWVGSGGGEFRTLCVRTCDGYFFPMSSASSEMDFDRDQQNCESMCPGTEVRLYHHRADEESDAMVSAATEDPYTALSTAYRYKDVGTPRPPGCGCSAAGNLATANAPQEEAPAEPVIPLPVARPDPASDPESLANAAGGLSVEAVRRLLKPRASATSLATGERKVRVVGPVFLPDQEGAIDLRAPGRKTVR